jgi:hypothetical protein
MPEPTEWRYLGDGLYVKYDGYHFVLAAGSNPEQPNDCVYLDGSVLSAFERFVNSLRSKSESEDCEEVQD